MTANERLAEIKARAEAATEGPWEWVATTPAMSGENWNMRVQGKPGIRFAVAEYQHGPDNAEFIAASRTDVPALVAALEAVLERHRATEETSDGRRWCVHCYDHAGNMIEAPCPTVQAVNEALEVDQ